MCTKPRRALLSHRAMRTRAPHRVSIGEQPLLPRRYIMNVSAKAEATDRRTCGEWHRCCEEWGLSEVRAVCFRDEAMRRSRTPIALTILAVYLGADHTRICQGSIGASAEDASLVQRELPHHGRDDRVDRRHGARSTKLNARPEHGDFSWRGG